MSDTDDNYTQRTAPKNYLRGAGEFISSKFRDTKTQIVGEPTFVLSPEAERHFNAASHDEKTAFIDSLNCTETAERAYWRQMFGDVKGFLLTFGMSYYATQDISNAFCVAAAATLPFPLNPFNFKRPLGRWVEECWKHVSSGFTQNQYGKKIETRWRTLKRLSSRKAASVGLDSAWQLTISGDLNNLGWFIGPRFLATLAIDWVTDRHIIDRIERGKIYYNVDRYSPEMLKLTGFHRPIADFTKSVWQPVLNGCYEALMEAKPVWGPPARATGYTMAITCIAIAPHLQHMPPRFSQLVVPLARGRMCEESADHITGPSVPGTLIKKIPTIVAGFS